MGAIVYRRWRHLFVFLGSIIALRLLQFSLFIL